VATAGAKAVIDYVLDHDLQANAAKQGARLMSGLRAVAERNSIVGDLRGKGLMIGIELVQPGGTTPSVPHAVAVLEETRRRGLLVGKGGLHNNVIRLAPPMTVTEDEVDEALDALGGAIAAAQEGK
jgi:4-aminobutyrate aminotransferase